MITVTFKPRRHPLPGEPSEEHARIVTQVVGWRLNLRQHVWRPPTDLYETDDRYVVRVEIAGMNEAEISISIDRTLLVITGTRPDTPERRAFHQMEIRYGEFGAEVELPGQVDLERITAVYANGFLQVDLPKAAPKEISINEQRAE